MGDEIRLSEEELEKVAEYIEKRRAAASTEVTADEKGDVDTEDTGDRPVSKDPCSGGHSVPPQKCPGDRPVSGEKRHTLTESELYTVFQALRECDADPEARSIVRGKLVKEI